jgi:hypothetical protein
MSTRVIRADRTGGLVVRASKADFTEIGDVRARIFAFARAKLSDRSNSLQCRFLKLNIISILQ